MKIGLVCPYIYPDGGGVAQHVGYLYENLRLRGHDVRIITASHGPQRSSEGDVIRLGVGFDPKLFTLPDMGPSPVKSDRPIAVIRPVTLRTEWCNPARNPKPEYIYALAEELMATHTVVAVASLAEGQEWAVGNLPPAHHHFLHGELPIRELLALVRDADIAVGGVGWIVPASLALKSRLFVVLGGHGGHNAPEKITDPRLDLSRIGFAMPEDYCRCTHMPHKCEKTIVDPVGQFTHWYRSSRLAA